MTVHEIDAARTRRDALKAELAGLNRLLKSDDAARKGATCPALSRWDFWNHAEVHGAYRAYLQARDVYGCFSPQAEEALAAYSRAAMGGANEKDVFKARLDRGISGRVSA